MGRLRPSSVKAGWIDPRTGESTSAGILPNRGVQSFTTPPGLEDALLVLEREGE
jgi:hypothetical protein